MYEITNPLTGQVFTPGKGNCWKNDLKKFKGLVADSRIVFGKDGKGRPQRKRFLWEAEERGLTPNTWWDDVGTTTNGTMELKAILGDKLFNNPKPLSLLRKVLLLGSAKNSIVLDSFAGSGTTAHAVLAQNKQDGGSRKFILIECEDYANKITAERMRRVIKGVPKARNEDLKEGLGGSFTYCTLGQEINVDTLLKGHKLPDFETLARYVFYTATGQTLEKVAKPGKDFFVGETDIYCVHLVYKPDREFLRSGASALNSELVQRTRPATNPRKKPSCLRRQNSWGNGSSPNTESSLRNSHMPYTACWVTNNVWS